MLDFIERNGAGLAFVFLFTLVVLISAFASECTSDPCKNTSCPEHYVGFRDGSVCKCLELKH